MSHKILMLCVRFPYPPKDGGAIAMYNMIEGFHAEGHDVTVFAINTPKHYVRLNNLPEAVKQKATYFAVDLNTRINYLDLLANLFFSKEAYHVERFYAKGVANALDKFLKDHVDKKHIFEYVQIETLYMCSYIPIIREHLKEAKIIYRAHNIEQEIWKRAAENTTSPLKEFYFLKTTERIGNFEKGIITNSLEDKKVDAIVTVSKRDSDAFKKLKAKPSVFTSNIGLDVAEFDRRWKSVYGEGENPLPPAKGVESLGYIGSMDWIGNTEGVNWFVKAVWPAIFKRYDQARFYLAGRNMPNSYRSLQDKRFIVEGEVEDAIDFMLSLGIMVVPLFTGSGMRVKILEGMALRRPIVATPTAVEGISVKHGQHLLIAESPEDFINCVSILLENPALGSIMGEQANKLVKSSFDYRALVKDLVKFYEKLK